MSGSDALLIVVRSGPGTPGGRRALWLASERAGRGECTVLALVADAVLLAGEAVDTGAHVVCLADDVSMRGLELEPAPRLHEATHAALVDLLLGEFRVLGAL